MAIKKQYLKSKPVCKVTFSVPAEEAKSVAVLGSFNEWSTKKATKLKKLKNGTFKGTVDLEKDNSYEFRYLVDGKSYINDEQADSYAWNDYAAAENGVLSV
ncbi:isoamylase early set domain-containing protein [Winogradskyella sp. PG-2]|uniref:isoamylase early set domain-containing protein n=1 Tax=Winogradskyella sp. PG-2 TaxID=754409 RepID=UPI0004586498|nr:isoamylase early set domain-containing protein [Winogradskyella sp. PG-2]BAO75001.1 1,4-alpha-glucan branching enzyme [Winogradskyella sp. PG-2]